MSLQEAPEKHEGSAGTGAPSQGMIFSAAARPDALSACIAGDASCQIHYSYSCHGNTEAELHSSFCYCLASLQMQ